MHVKTKMSWVVWAVVAVVIVTMSLVAATIRASGEAGELYPVEHVGGWVRFNNLEGLSGIWAT